MRLTIILTAAVAVAFAFAAGAESERTAEKETETVTIELTKDQADAVKNARGKSVTVTLTKEQISAISNSISGYKVNNKITLSSANLTSNDEIVLELSVPDDPTSYLKMNPTPSP